VQEVYTSSTKKNRPQKFIPRVQFEEHSNQYKERYGAINMAVNIA